MREERRRELEFLEKVRKFDLFRGYLFLTFMRSDYHDVP